MEQKKHFNYDVFLCHNSNDKVVVRIIAEKLRKAGLKIWFDEWRIKPGDDIYLKIESGLEESRTLILFLSPNAINSNWANLERSTAIFRDPTNADRRFIPVLIKDCELPDTLKRYRYIDFRESLDSSLENIINACINTGDIDEIIWSSNKADELNANVTDEIKSKIKEAEKAGRSGKYELAKEIWTEISETAANKNQKLSIRVRLELAYIEASEGSNDLDNALKIANECLIESKKINLGDQIVRILQLLGEVHRFKRNIDKARGYLNAALQHSQATNDLLSEGWALIALAMLSNDNEEVFETQYNYTIMAYDVFTKLMVSGKADDSVSANSGYGFCHLVRAKIYGYKRHEEALTEYSQAISIYRDLGEEGKFELARLLLERGEMKALHEEVISGVQDINEALEIFYDLKDQYMAAKCILVLAEILDQTGHRKEAENYYLSAVKTAEPIKNEAKKSWFYFRYAMKLIELGEHEKAKKILLYLLSIETLKDSQKLDVLKTITNLAKAAKDEKELKEYLEYSLTIIDKLLSEAQSPKERLRLLFNKGQTFHDLEKYELALEFFERTMKLAESISAKDRLPEVWSSIAEVYNKMKNQTKEREAYEQVLKLCEEDTNSPYIVTTLTMIAQTEMQQGNFDVARRQLDRAEILCKKIMPFMMFVINDIRQSINDKEKKSKRG